MTEKSVFTFQAAYVTAPCEITYSPSAEEILVQYANLSQHGTAQVQVRFSREGLKELVLAIRHLETHPDKPLESLFRPRSVQ